MISIRWDTFHSIYLQNVGNFKANVYLLKVTYLLPLDLKTGFIFFFQFIQFEYPAVNEQQMCCTYVKYIHIQQYACLNIATVGL